MFVVFASRWISNRKNQTFYKIYIVTVYFFEKKNQDFLRNLHWKMEKSLEKTSNGPIVCTKCTLRFFFLRSILNQTFCPKFFLGIHHKVVFRYELKEICILLHHSHWNGFFVSRTSLWKNIELFDTKLTLKWLVHRPHRILKRWFIKEKLKVLCFFIFVICGYSCSRKP